MSHADLRSALLAPADHEAVAEWSAQLDAHFDGIASNVVDDDVVDGAGSAAPSRVLQRETIEQSASRRLADERLRFAERADAWLMEISRLKNEIGRLTAREAALRQEMADVAAHARHEVQRADLWRQHNVKLESETVKLASENADLSRAQAVLVAADAISARDIAGKAERIDTLSRENKDLTHEVERLHEAIRRFERSRSWRYLAPARAAGRMLRRLAGIRP
jgi:cell division protein FtsB